jgi:hypothetical protein
MDCDCPLAESGDRLKDVMGGFGPAEGPRRGVVVGNKGCDRFLQFGDTTVNAAPDLSLGQEREPALDLISQEA